MARKKIMFKGSSSTGAVYGLGMLGAIIYYFHTATVFTDYLIGILKAFLWPGFLVYQAFSKLGM